MTKLTQQQINELQHLMSVELNQLVDDTQDEMDIDLKENYIDIENDVGDKADEAFADTTIDIDNAVIGLHLQKVSDLNAALDRVKSGDYGICIDCGNEVGFERLSVYPTAKRCISCQELREKKFPRTTKSSY